MDEVLVVHFSHAGTCRALAQFIATPDGWSLGAIEERRPRDGWQHHLRCAVDALARREPVIDYIGPWPEQFRRVVLVAPTRFGRLAAPMRSFVTAWRERLPEVALVVIGSPRAKAGAAAEVERLLGRPLLLVSAFTMDEVRDGGYVEHLHTLGDELAEARVPRWRPAAAAPRLATA